MVADHVPDCEGRAVTAFFRSIGIARPPSSLIRSGPCPNPGVFPLKRPATTEPTTIGQMPRGLSAKENPLPLPARISNKKAPPPTTTTTTGHRGGDSSSLTGRFVLSTKNRSSKSSYPKREHYSLHETRHGKDPCYPAQGGSRLTRYLRQDDHQDQKGHQECDPGRVEAALAVGHQRKTAVQQKPG